MQIAQKTIGKMFIMLDKEGRRGAIGVGNLSDPKRIVNYTGFHCEFADMKAAYDKLVTPKDVHNYFDD